MKKDPRCANSESHGCHAPILFPRQSLEPFSICHRSKDDDCRSLIEAGAIVDEWHPVFDPGMSLRVDRLIALAELLHEEES